MEKYEVPEAEVIRFAIEDVITASETESETKEDIVGPEL